MEKRGRRDLNPQPPDRQSDEPQTQVHGTAEDEGSSIPACTAACTDNPDFDEPVVVSLEFIADVLLSLSPEDWLILTQMLASRVETDG
jgi:hypothetical protein